MSSTYGGRRPYDRRRMQSAYDFDDDSMFRTRKRARGALGARRDDGGPAVQVVVAKKGLRIGNNEDVWKFYEQRFKSIQQTACKTIAKAWIKLIAPKKQSNHPYTGQEAKAPDWWPKPTGSTKEERVRHKEPDHLHKPGRSHNYCERILRRLIRENRAHLAIESHSGFDYNAESPTASRHTEA